MDEVDDLNRARSFSENHEMLADPGKPQILAQVIGKGRPAGLMGHVTGRDFPTAIKQRVDIAAHLGPSIMVERPNCDVVQGSFGAV